MKKTFRFLTLLLIVTLLIFGVTAWNYLQQARECILPGVTVAGVDVGGLHPDAATDRLARDLPAPDTHTLTLRAAGHTWPLTWADIDRRYDAAASAQAAFALGRDLSAWAYLQTCLRAAPVALPPVALPADTARITAAVALHSDALYIPPVDATLTLNDGRPAVTPAQPGQRLDVAASVAAVQTALAEEAATVDLVLAVIPPQRPTVEPAYSRINRWLAQPFTLIVDDPLTGERDADDLPTGYRAAFDAPPARIATWITLTPRASDIAAALDAAAVQAWLITIDPQLGDERQFDYESTQRAILHALYTDQTQATATIRHPSRSYTVQPGDSFSLIAYENNLPMWPLVHANPGVDPGAIDVGQVITIPSVDVLIPRPLVPGKHLDVNLYHQTVTAYENGSPIFTFTISSGISRTPTIDGQFQILFKEENAYAQRWQLDMPYFMGIYEEKQGFFNGFHELPITSYGTRLSAGVLGYPASFGCIILDEGDAATLYHWADLGTLVRIRGYAPGTPTWQQTLADIAPLEEDGE